MTRPLKPRLAAGSTAVSDCFVPCAENGLRARRAIHARLHESLQHIFQQCSGIVEFPATRAAALLRRTESGQHVPPALFCDYFALVETIKSGERAPIDAALHKLLQHAEHSGVPALAVRPFTAAGFAGEEAGFRRNFISDSLRDEQIDYVDAAREPEIVAQFNRALELLRRHAPRTYAEMQCLVCEFVPAFGNTINGSTFDGCSSLERWGTILINAKQDKSDLELSETLTHEGAHNALFALSPVNFHVENPPEERYPSPLRDDPRPINGIYHATFVLARMCFAMTEVQTSAAADAALREQAAALAKRSAKLFADGYRVLHQHARYTAEGEAIMRDALRFMRQRPGGEALPAG